jgi:hypothetical protein
MELVLAVVALALLGVASISWRLSGTTVTPTMLLVAIGLLVGPQVLDAVDLSSKSSTVQVLADATLALVLFCDAPAATSGTACSAAGVVDPASRVFIPEG